ncbi:MAG: hypothetical protein EOO38_27980 [Cytophagaceae bacterium]|nr:MAG: hypothetical protein EOO38_27980 [Cytophagaceae bacterium]
MEKIETLWNALRQVHTLEFVAHSRSNTGWTGKGAGSVIVESPTPESIVFHESGLWHPTAGKNIEFRNIYRWLRSGDTVRLEHLRFGEENSVYLFDLAPDSDTVWSSVAPHLCRQDEYVALLEIQESVLSLHWKITGPAKNEEILYRYR